MKKLDLKSEETLTYIIAGCTAVAVLVLLIDLQICKVLLKRADALDLKVTNREHEQNGSGIYAPETHHGDSVSSPVFRDFSRSRLVGNTGMETQTDSDEASGTDPEPSPWDEFPASRSNAGTGIRSVEISEDGGGNGE